MEAFGGDAELEVISGREVEEKGKRGGRAGVEGGADLSWKMAAKFPLAASTPSINDDNVILALNSSFNAKRKGPRRAGWSSRSTKAIDSTSFGDETWLHNNSGEKGINQ